ncbi:MAG: hypothetical protein AMJ94_08615 [Deltaproteobacteria bacterium SM23_61]|nr:MAG: hypothetical protein AMJ94_08615 [Deltaproteobacteria bacterium SM23_61]
MQRTGQEAEKVIRFEYNGLNRVTRLTGPPPELNQTLYDYDLNGNIRSVIDGNGNPTWYEYNYQGKVSKIMDALGHETYLKYGTGCPTCGAGVDKLTLVMDARKQTTVFEYDQAGNLGKETDPLGYSTSYKYDSARNLRSRTDAKGNRTDYFFDELNRLKEVRYPDQTTVAFSYDYRGNLKTAANSNIAYTFAYDFNNRLTEVTDSNGRSLSYRYNELGNRTRMVTPDGRVIEYKYDNRNYLSQVLVNSVPQVNLVHDPYGRRVGLGYASGISTSYSYNPSGYLTNLLTRDSQQATINSFAYTHDGVGNRKTMTELNGVHGYDYDKIYQLIGAIHPNMPGETFQYDPVGNRIEKVSKGTGEKIVYFYDFENRLIKVESPGLIAQYKYNPFGRRIEKNVNGTITRYAYDGPNILLEYDGENNIKSRYLHNLAIDDPMSVEQGGKIYYYQKDGLGSVVALTDEAGKVVQSYAYDSFGKIINQAGSFGNTFTYTAREYDEETALYYYRARYYDPRTGKFLTKDPIGFAGGDVNVYRYVTNNPVNRIDPLGLYDLWDFGEDTLSFAAGLGNAVTFGGSTWIAEQFMSSGDATILRRTKRCSKAFKGGEWASLALGGGRLAYAGIAKGASMIYAARGATMANAAAVSAFRNGLKQVFRLGLWRDARIYTLERMVEKYGTAEEILAAAGRTDLEINAIGAWAASGGTITLATSDDCWCK